MNITGSPDYGSQASCLVGDPGSGCSDNQYAQFNVARSRAADLRQRGPGVGPQHPARLRGQHASTWRSCATSAWAAARQLQFRLDVFNAFNTVVINARQAQVQYNSPTDQTLRNSQFLADGSLDPARLKPNNAGFGARDRRAEHAQPAAADPVPVLNHHRTGEASGPHP